MLDRAEINAELLTELTKLLLCDVKVMTSLAASFGLAEFLAKLWPIT